MENKTGILTDIIYHNKDNGYTIGIIENEQTEEQFTAVGYLHNPYKGREYSFTGKWKTHSTYGEQFAFETYIEEVPKTAEGIKGFLSSGIMKGIGKKTAQAMVNKFGEDTLRIIEEAPERLTEVEGIGSVKSKSIAEAFQSHREFAEIVLYFQRFGISTGYAMRLYKVYGKDTVKAIEEDPYQLVDDVFGIGFRKADKIASLLGIPPNDPKRIRSGIRYMLSIFIGEGHTFLPQKFLCEQAGQLLDIGSEEVYEKIVEMAFDAELHVENLEGRAVVYPIPYFLAEQKVCRKLIDIDRAILKPIKGNIPELIESTENELGFRLSDNQKHAIEISLGSGVAVVTGGPGTGKTTIINAIIAILHNSGLTTAIAAPTGRAAKKITETSGHSASTIHRLLEYYYSEGEDTMRFGKNEESPLQFDAVIIDEASMIDILLMKGLLDAISEGTRLIIVGDADQLPSVGAGNVLRDIIDSEVVSSIKLIDIFRQAKESLIVVNAHRINKGEYPLSNEKDKDFFLLQRKGEKEMLATIKDLCIRRLPSYFKNCDPMRDLQILTPIRKGMLGCNNLNKELQHILNPPDSQLKEKRMGERVFRVGDKVMQIKNNYQLEWKRFDDFSEGQGVFNGDCGFIHAIDNEFNEITVVYEEAKYVTYDVGNLDEIELAYAVTVHKSQGSEFPIVIMPISWFPPMLATRNLLYTAVTRAKNAVVLVGSENKMRGMVDNNSITERYSGLKPKLKEFLL
ncbi:MAG TPA: ATP-dependent RecD-like DNA helicase [Anaerovoracaceae bacterium]|nr:ATP-dependent RecD-like DNA helicase [Anaerovoracaceae bacterium]